MVNLGVPDWHVPTTGVMASFLRQYTWLAAEIGASSTTSDGGGTTV